MVYIGKYSPREGTAASKLEDDISLKVKKQRERKLRGAVNEIRTKKHSELVGKEIPILMISPNKGISYYNHELITEKELKPGQIYNLKVTDFSRSGLRC
jgi:tRNA A37 methylthiotransferase MiaB